MAATKLQINIIDRLSDVSFRLLGALDEIAVLVQYANAESITSLTAEDLAALPELAHIAPGELAAARNALSELLTAAGGYATGTIMTRLSKVTKNIP